VLKRGGGGEKLNKGRVQIWTKKKKVAGERDRRKLYLEKRNETQTQQKKKKKIEKKLK